ncbi:hypothetical protein LSAT2_020023 [Lamellibrachia satsuma]|nr:hypothetical protein LSAT2_020023 [Lamellibrachia satsuma]
MWRRRCNKSSDDKYYEEDDEDDEEHQLEPDTPVDVDSFLMTASVDCSVRLWTLGGLFMGIFGQSRLWQLNADNQDPPRYHRTDKYNRPRGFLLPPDVRKCGSSTTLHVMNGFTPNRWIRFVNLVRGVNAFMSSLRRSSSERIAKEQRIQAILDIPVATKMKHKRLVVESIAPKARVRPAPFKPRIPHFRMQCPAFRAFPLQEVKDIDFPYLKDMLKTVKERYGFPHRDHVHTVAKFARIVRQTTRINSGFGQVHFESDNESAQTQNSAAQRLSTLKRFAGAGAAVSEKFGRH